MRQTLDTPLYALWRGTGDDAVFVGLMPMPTLQRLLFLKKEAEQRILRETAEGNGWCAIHDNRNNVTYYICYSSKLWQSAGVGPGVEVA
jgi:hypothetical protein